MLRAGCGLPAFAGRTGDRLFFDVLQASQPRRFSFELSSSTLIPATIPPGRLTAYPGAAPVMWTVTRDQHDPKLVTVSRITPRGGETETASFVLPFGATGRVAWVLDANENPWLFIDRGGEVVAVFRRDGSSWLKEVVVRSALRMPHLDPITGDIIMGRWRFTAGGLPQPVNPPPPYDPRYPGLIDVFPTGAGELLAIPPGYEASLLRNGTWQRVPGPWKAVDDARPSLVPGDGPAPIVAWRDGDLLRAHRWKDAEWVQVAVIDRTKYPGGGPMLMIDDTLIVMGGCYRFEVDGVESITVTTAKGDVVSTRKVVSH